MMNKKEQAEFDDAKQQATMAISLGWPTLPKPKPMNVDRSSGNLTIGYFINVHTAITGRSWNGEIVTKGCSNGINHNPNDSTKTSTQGRGLMYETKAQALLALRWEVCEHAAKVLAAIDQAIILDDVNFK